MSRTSKNFLLFSIQSSRAALLSSPLVPRMTQAAITTTANTTPMALTTMLSSDAGLEMGGVLNTVSAAGVAQFTGTVMRGELGKTYQARVQCTRSSSSSSSSVSAASSSSVDVNGGIKDFDFSIRIGMCLPGYEPLITATTIAASPVPRECVRCKDRTFNFDGRVCKPCPLGGDCLGGDTLLSETGWWRSSNTSEVLFACPRPDACVAGNVTANDACTVSYAGPVCGECRCDHTSNSRFIHETFRISSMTLSKLSKPHPQFWISTVGRVVRGVFQRGNKRAAHSRLARVFCIHRVHLHLAHSR